MENEFAEVMSQRTDEELIKILTVEKHKYQPLAIEAAESEMQKRNIDTSDFEEIKEKATLEQQQEKQVQTTIVGSGIRLANFIVDFIVWIIIGSIISLILELFITITDRSIMQLMGYIIMLGTYVAYYAIMETQFQKTVGKFVTKTKVVKMNGDKPTASDIITRSLCRLIPFDRLSFLFVKNGIHDFLSKTTVVKD